jgi:hypothetical protein
MLMTVINGKKTNGDLLLQYTQADFKEVRGVVIVHMSTPHFPLKEVKALSSYGQHFKPGVYQYSSHSPVIESRIIQVVEMPES